MLSLISTLGGLLISGLPKLLEHFQNKADQRHELALASLQNERELALAAQGFAAQARVEEIRTEQVAMQTQAQMAEAEAEMVKGAQDHDKTMLQNGIHMGRQLHWHCAANGDLHLCFRAGRHQRLLVLLPVVQPRPDHCMDDVLKYADIILARTKWLCWGHYRILVRKS
jgi:hypothetical protein